MIVLELIIFAGIAFALYWFAPQILPRVGWSDVSRAALGVGVALALFLLQGVYHLSTGDGPADATGIQQALLCRIHHFSHCTNTAPSPEAPVATITIAAPRVLVLDRAAVQARYMSTGATDAEQRIATELNALMDQYEANLLFDRAAIVSGADSVDITPQLIADLDKTVAHGNTVPAPPVNTVDQTVADSPRFLVADRAAISGAFPQGANIGPKIAPALQAVLQDRSANLILDRNAVVLGPGEIDATSDIIRKINAQGGTSQASIVAPVIVVVDRAAILAKSRAGKSMVDQVRKLIADARSDLKPRGDALLAEQTALKARLPHLSGDDRDVALSDFRAKYTAFQADVFKRQAAIQSGLTAARKQVEDALLPIIKGLMAQRHANLLLDRRAVVLGRGKDIDVTAPAVERLDRAMSSVSVETP